MIKEFGDLNQLLLFKKYDYKIIFIGLSLLNLSSESKIY